jgi:hypothetical protein
MSGRSALQRLAEWYSRQCDGDWEHDWRVRISTIDNPGWLVEINLEDTTRPHGEFRPIVREGSKDWLDVRFDGTVFRGAGGSGNLADIVEEFLAWIA